MDSGDTVGAKTRAELSRYFRKQERKSKKKMAENERKQKRSRREEPKDSSKRSKRSSSNGSSLDDKAKCPVHPDHDHTWGDCFNNPKNKGKNKNRSSDSDSKKAKYEKKLKKVYAAMKAK